MAESHAERYRKSVEPILINVYLDVHYDWQTAAWQRSNRGRFVVKNSLSSTTTIPKEEDFVGPT